MNRSESLAPHTGKIIEAISSVYPEDLNSNESCPSLLIKDLNITESEEKKAFHIGWRNSIIHPTQDATK